MKSKDVHFIVFIRWL